jgi:hypothetical protein
LIGIVLDRDVVEAGAFLTGTLQWIEEAGRPARRLFAVLEWRTDGQGNRARGIGRVAQIAVAPGQHEGSFPVRLLVPYEGPISFEGHLISIHWCLRVSVDQRGADDHLEAEFKVVPRGKLSGGRLAGGRR